MPQSEEHWRSSTSSALAGLWSPSPSPTSSTTRPWAHARGDRTARGHEPRGLSVDGVGAHRRGLDELLAALDRAIPIRKKATIPGCGSTAASPSPGRNRGHRDLARGPLRVGDTLRVHRGSTCGCGVGEPRAGTRACRGTPAGGGEPGRCPEDLGRGAMLGLPGRWDTTSRFTAEIRLARYVDELTGAAPSSCTSEPPRRRPGSGCWRKGGDHPGPPSPLRYGDRFIVRETGRRASRRRRRVLDPAPPRADRLSGRLRPCLRICRLPTPPPGCSRSAAATPSPA